MSKFGKSFFESSEGDLAKWSTLFGILFQSFWTIFPTSKWEWTNKPKHGVFVAPKSDHSELVT